MVLKKQYSKKDDIPEGQEGFYTEADGAWVLDVEGGFGDGDKSKIDEFRTNNTELQKKLDRLASEKDKILKQFEGLTPEAVAQAKKLVAAAQEEEGKKLLAEGRFDEYYGRQYASVIEEKERTIKEKDRILQEREAALGKLKSAVAATTASTATSRELGRMNVRPAPGADEELQLLTHAYWTADDDGKLVPRKTVRNDKGDEMSHSEWLQRTVKSKPYLFEQARGGGGGGGGDGDVADGVRVIVSDNYAEDIAKYRKDILANKVVVKKRE